MAMEARCYHGGEGRTRMKAMRMHNVDGRAIVVMSLYMIICGTVYFML